MEGYSNITEISIQNFMSIGNATLKFDDQNIITAVGYNDSGKSAIQRAIAVLVANKFKNKQTQLIKEGEGFFKVSLSFDDGVEISYRKNLDGTTQYSMSKDGKKVLDTKKGDFQASANGVPTIIQDYLGVCVTDNNTLLNYRSVYDNQLLVDTKGSENYGMLNDILKSSETSRAVQRLNKDRNTLNSQMLDKLRDIEATKIAMERYENLTEDLLDALKSKGESEEKELKNANTVFQIRDVFTEYIQAQKVTVGKELDRVDTKEFEQIGGIVNQINGYQDLQLKFSGKIDRIETDQVEQISELADLIKSVEDLDNGIIKFDKIDSNPAKNLKGIISILGQYSKVEEDLSKNKEQLSKLKSQKDGLMEEIISAGIKYKKCDNCGNYVIWDK